MDESSFFSKGALSDLNITETNELDSINQEEYLNQIRAETFRILHLRSKAFSQWKAIILTQKEATNKEYQITKYIYNLTKRKFFKIIFRKFTEMQRIHKIGDNLKLFKFFEIWVNSLESRNEEEKKQINFFLNSNNM